jgi:hypothetical protein
MQAFWRKFWWVCLKRYSIAVATIKKVRPAPLIRSPRGVDELPLFDAEDQHHARCVS